MRLVLQRTCLAAGVIGYAAIVALSVVPGSDRPHTGAGGGFEHFAANALVAGALALGLANMRQRLLALLWLCASAGILEVAQIYIPGRNAELWGLLTSSAGACAGMLAGAVAARSTNPDTEHSHN